MLYEHRKHTGELPVIGVNTYLAENSENLIPKNVELRRATDEEKHEQIDNVAGLQERNAERIAASLAELQRVALTGGNTFAQMMETARYASLGQISSALYKVGGQYRRSM